MIELPHLVLCDIIGIGKLQFIFETSWYTGSSTCSLTLFTKVQKRPRLTNPSRVLDISTTP